MTACPICLTDATETRNEPYIDGKREGDRINCPRCGAFFLSGTLSETLPIILGEDTTPRSLLSHAVRKMQRENYAPFLDNDIVGNVLQGSLPTFSQQADNLLLWLGAHLKEPGEEMVLNPKRHQSIVGSRTPDSFRFVIQHLIHEGFLQGKNAALSKNDFDLRVKASVTATLSFAGWDRYEELRRGVSESKKAFMAMKFNNADLDRVIKEAFTPATEKAGFSLLSLNEDKRAGLIDDKIRVRFEPAVF